MDSGLANNEAYVEIFTVCGSLVNVFISKGRIGDLSYEQSAFQVQNHIIFYLYVITKIVGWSMRERLQKQLVEDALVMAIGRRKLHGKLIHHSDQGSQYTSHEFLKLLAQQHIQVSMSGAGNCYDNAMMESFFATLKTECVTERFETRQQARQTIFEYIEVWYNRRRRHSALGYLSPEEFEQLVA